MIIVDFYLNLHHIKSSTGDHQRIFFFAEQ